MTAAFLLPMAQGACSALGETLSQMPLCGRDGCHDTAYHDPGHGLASRIRAKRGVQEGCPQLMDSPGHTRRFELLDDDAIIEL